MGLPYRYDLFELNEITQIDQVFATENLKGLNVTVPFKTQVLPLLDTLSPEAAAIGAVNTIAFDKGKTMGFNTDASAFMATLSSWLPDTQSRALVLGTGGASRAVVWALDQLDMAHQIVSRSPGPDLMTYDQLTAKSIEEHTLIINTTPLGMSPDTGGCPSIIYSALTEDHCLYDLIYNPEKTLFLKQGERRGASTKNGLEMLYLQADYAWNIWKSYLDGSQ